MSRSANAHVGQNSGKSRVNAKYAAIVRRLAEAEYSTSQERRRRRRLVYSDQRFLSLQLASLRDSSLLSRLASSAEVQTNSDEPLVIPRFAKCCHASGGVGGSAPGQGVGARTEPPGRVWLGAVQGLNETNLRRVRHTSSRQRNSMSSAVLTCTVIQSRADSLPAASPKPQPASPLCIHTIPRRFTHNIPRRPELLVSGQNECLRAAASKQTRSGAV